MNTLLNKYGESGDQFNIGQLVLNDTNEVLRSLPGAIQRLSLKECYELLGVINLSGTRPTRLTTRGSSLRNKTLGNGRLSASSLEDKIISKNDTSKSEVSPTIQFKSTEIELVKRIEGNLLLGTIVTQLRTNYGFFQVTKTIIRALLESRLAILDEEYNGRAITPNGLPPEDDKYRGLKISLNTLNHGILRKLPDKVFESFRVSMLSSNAIMPTPKLQEDMIKQSLSLMYEGIEELLKYYVNEFLRNEFDAFFKRKNMRTTSPRDAKVERLLDFLDEVGTQSTGFEDSSVSVLRKLKEYNNSKKHDGITNPLNTLLQYNFDEIIRGVLDAINMRELQDTANF